MIAFFVIVKLLHIFMMKFLKIFCTLKFNQNFNFIMKIYKNVIIIYKNILKIKKEQ